MPEAYWLAMLRSKRKCSHRQQPGSDCNSFNNSYRMYAASPANATSFDFIQALRSVEFVYNSSAEKEKSIGFCCAGSEICHKQFCCAEHQPVTLPDNEYPGLKTSELTPVMAKAMQEQQKRNRAVEKICWGKKLRSKTSSRGVFPGCCMLSSAFIIFACTCITLHLFLTTGTITGFLTSILFPFRFVTCPGSSISDSSFLM